MEQNEPGKAWQNGSTKSSLLLKMLQGFSCQVKSLLLKLTLIYIIKLHALLRREQFLKYLNRTMEKRYHTLLLASLFMSQLCGTYYCPTIVAIVLIISMLSAKSWTTIYYVVIHLSKYFIVSWWKECFSWREGKWNG